MRHRTPTGGWELLNYIGLKYGAQFGESAVSAVFSRQALMRARSLPDRASDMQQSLGVARDINNSLDSDLFHTNSKGMTAQVSLNIDTNP